MYSNLNGDLARLIQAERERTIVSLAREREARMARRAKRSPTVNHFRLRQVARFLTLVRVPVQRLAALVAAVAVFATVLRARTEEPC